MYKFTKKKLFYETQILKNRVNINVQLLEPCTNPLAGENFRGTRTLTHILKKWSVVVVVFFASTVNSYGHIRMVS